MKPVMEMLRDETAELHQAAEHQEFQQRLARASLVRTEYAAWLGQMYHVHGALEGALARCRQNDLRFAAVRPEHFKEPLLRADLADLGIAPPPLLPSTARWLERAAADERDQPLRLLGCHYVLEGSNNGNRMIARRLLPALGLTPGFGGRYVDPYGERQREIWARFKEEMTALDFAPEERRMLLEGARAMFVSISELSAELAGIPSGAA